MAKGWITQPGHHGAATIHDGNMPGWVRSTESVREGVAAGNFGTWDETAANIPWLCSPAVCKRRATVGRWGDSSRRMASTSGACDAARVDSRGARHP